MQKILVEIFIPALGVSYDAYIPIRMPLHQLRGLVAQAALELTGGKFVPSAETAFCDRRTGAVYDVDMSARDLCLHNGSCLMLI